MILRGSFFSRVLQSETGLSVFVPDKPDDNAALKVAYLLHGVRNNADSWSNKTMLPSFGNQHNTIIIMPDGGRSFYMDMKYGANFYTYISEELPEMTKRIFNISPKPADTAIIGASIGGFGALRAAFDKPGQYGCCCAISAGGLYMKSMFDNVEKTEELLASSFGSQIVTDLHSAFGDELSWKPEYELMESAKNYPADCQKPKLFMTCGADDVFITDNRRFSEEIKTHGFSVAYEENPGKHDWFYFNDGLRASLDFFSGLGE